MMKSKWLHTASVSVFCCLVFLLVGVPPSSAGVADRVSEVTLGNGLKVVLLENHKAPLITFQVWYRVGSRNEEWGRTGLSHMLEHMMFKGTEKTGPEEFSRIIQENGGNDNAFTSRDFTAYFENLSSDRTGVAIDLEADRMENLRLREEDFRTERMVVMEERRMRTEDNPSAFLQEQLEAAAFQLQPYHWPVIGWMEDVKSFTLDDVRAYYKKYYNPVNAFIVVVGDFRKREILGKIEKTFGSIPEGISPAQKRDIDPPQTGERRVYVKREAQLPSIVIAYHVPNLKQPDSYALEVLATILSGGKSSRLYKDLVLDKRLAFNVDADNPLLSRDPSLFYLSADLQPGKSVVDAEKALDEEIDELQKEPVDEKELEKAKNQIEASFIYGQDSLFYQAMLLAQYEIAASWRAIDDYLPSIRRVTQEDIMRVAGQYLNGDNRTVGILIPLPPGEGKAAPSGVSPKAQIVR
jgi:zinc protease